MARNKEVLTTGEVARICKVAPRTVTKWFDSGQLRGYRIPGSKDRRIPVSQLIRFMRQNNMPLDGMLHFTKTRILIVDDEAEIVDMLKDLLSQHSSYDVHVANGFEAGCAAEKVKPHVILLDINLPDIDGKEVCKIIRQNPDLQMTKVLAMSGHITDDEAKSLINVTRSAKPAVSNVVPPTKPAVFNGAGQTDSPEANTPAPTIPQYTDLRIFDGFLKKPFTIQQVIQSIEDAVAVVY